MANFAITANNVVPSNVNAGSMVTKAAGAAINAGQAVYLDVNGVWQLGQASNQAKIALSGIAMESVQAGQLLTVATAGDIQMNNAFASAGIPVFLSATAGALCPAADVGSGSYLVFVGYSTAVNILRLGLLNTGIAVP